MKFEVALCVPCIGVKPNKNDDYICTGVKVKELAPTKLWVTSFEAISSGNKAHHMIISKCKVRNIGVHSFKPFLSWYFELKDYFLKTNSFPSL